jgi:hypothetical protein
MQRLVTFAHVARLLELHKIVINQLITQLARVHACNLEHGQQFEDIKK